MYEFKKLKGEIIQYISDNALLKKDKENKLISVIITNKRLLLLDYPSQLNNYQEVLRTSQNIDYMRKKEIIFETNLDEVLKIENDKITLKNGNYFYLIEENIKKYIIS